MTLQLTIASDDRTFAVSVDPTETVENLKALIEVETGMLIKDQVLLFQGGELNNSATLTGAGVGNGEVLFVSTRGALQTESAQGEPTYDWDPVAIQQYFRNNPDKLQQLLHNNPTMAEAVLSDDLTLLSNLLAERQAERQKVELERALRMAQLAADPFDPKAQQMIEEEIRLENIKDNMEQAIEYNPEAFGRVVMLYIDCEVNKTPVKAFVDSGAQSTIMSTQCAKRCGIERLIDTRWAGMARGVGTARIIGRVHVAPIKIGNSFFSSSFTILEGNQGTDLLLGLDMLRKHQCIIDLKDSVLRIGDEAVPFLSEKDIPRDIRFEDMQEEQDIARSPLLPSPPSSSTTPASFALPRSAPAPAPVPAPLPTRTSSTTSGGSAPMPAPSGSVGLRPTPTPTPTSTFIPTPTAIPIPTSTAIPAGNVSEDKVRQLTDLGYSRAEAIRALTLFNGNVELAASSLFGEQSFGF
jgi:DNA damage-inducible protein 1